MSDALDRATQAVTESDLAEMVLTREELPQELEGFQSARLGVLDNETMADNGFSGTTTGETRATGRITGYLSEFVNAEEANVIFSPQEGSNLVAATVVHLFHDKEEVSSWMNDRFLGEFKYFVGKDMGRGQQLLKADPMDFTGFADESVGLQTLQTAELGLVSSTVVDFRVGRLLGVAYVVATGDVQRRGLVSEMGVQLERKMVKVSLDAG